MNKMKDLRLKKRISMKEAAKELHIPYTTYVNYEKGYREPNFEMLIKIADYYNSSIDYLLGKVDKPNEYISSHEHYPEDFKEFSNYSDLKDITNTI